MKGSLEIGLDLLKDQFSGSLCWDSFVTVAQNKLVACNLKAKHLQSWKLLLFSSLAVYLVYILKIKSNLPEFCVMLLVNKKPVSIVSKKFEV